MFTCETTKIGREKHRGNVRSVFACAGIMEIFPEMHTPPGGTGPAAKRQWKDIDFAWLRGAVLVLGYFDVQMLGKMDFEKLSEGLNMN